MHPRSGSMADEKDHLMRALGFAEVRSGNTFIVSGNKFRPRPVWSIEQIKIA
ncbi:MAG: hypothetical protein JWR26_2898 [Pedosphaera sp.]|nr:hypothetical protein [Pedosphaera sp.]